MNRLNDDDCCFVCGQSNSKGLGLKFRFSENSMEAESTITFPQHFQGWSNIVHGGLLSTVLDEIMVKPAENMGIKCVTAELKVKFRKPAKTGNEYKIYGHIKEIRGRKILGSAEIISKEGETVAEATGIMLEIK